MPRSGAARCMNIEGSSGQHFPNWDEAFAHYAAHYCRGCVHVLLPTSAQCRASPARSATPNSIASSPRQKKSKTVKSPVTGSAVSKRCRRRRCSSSSSAGNYRSLYEDDEPVRPNAAEPAPPPSAVTLDDYFPKAGTAGNPIEVPSNFPPPVANQKNPKPCNRIPAPFPITPTPASAPPTYSVKPLVYVCDCSDEEGGYSASRMPSLKRKATTTMKDKSATSLKRKPTSAQFLATANVASSSKSQPIDILTDSETDTRTPPKLHICECLHLHLQMSTSSSTAQPDFNPDTHMDTDDIPQLPHLSPSAHA